MDAVGYSSHLLGFLYSTVPLAPIKPNREGLQPNKCWLLQYSEARSATAVFMKVCLAHLGNSRGLRSMVRFMRLKAVHMGTHGSDNNAAFIQVSAIVGCLISANSDMLHGT